MERFSLRNEAEPLAAEVAKMEADFVAAPSDPALLYGRAFAHYAEASAARAAKDKEAAEKHLMAAAGLLERVPGEAWEAEAVAFRGYLLNQMIGLKGGMAAMRLGPQSSELLARAGALAPENPRVLFFRGVSLVKTPEMWGGDIPAGIKLLERAAAAFERQPADARVHWGRAEALAWLGIARKKAGDLAGARRAWEQALAVEPGYGWAKHVLLPSLEKGSGKKPK